LSCKGGQRVILIAKLQGTSRLRTRGILAIVSPQSNTRRRPFTDPYRSPFTVRGLARLVT
jgi:hypothetical protein